MPCNMLRYVTLMVLVLANRQTPRAEMRTQGTEERDSLYAVSLPSEERSVVFRTDLIDGGESFLDSTRQENLLPNVQPRLLPENMSLLERGLWGEKGALRGIGIAGALTPEARKSELSARRFMLTAHQIGGFVTLGLMGTSVYFGQKFIDHRRRSDLDVHESMVQATILSYAATGALALLSPPPLVRRDETSTTTIHKTLAWVHVGGMILTPLLAEGERRSDDKQTHLHQLSGYITTAVFAASMIVMTF